MKKLFLLAAVAAMAALAQDLPRGEIIDSVKCASDSSQTYALYLPSHYSKDQKWKLILAFDPRGRGRTPVETYQAAAEKYGYIVAGSNNARNGPPEISLTAAGAMGSDIVQRFSIDMQRVYTAGLSGGARIAMKVAMDSNEMAGVIASSAGFPPGVCNVVTGPSGEGGRLDQYVNDRPYVASSFSPPPEPRTSKISKCATSIRNCTAPIAS
jgi:poly(3-hydroxybutyrate) depolymerase